MARHQSMLFNLRGVRFREGTRDWRKEPDALRRVFQCASEAGLWWNFAYYQKNFTKRHHPLKSLNDFLEVVAASKHFYYELQGGGAEPGWHH